MHRSPCSYTRSCLGLQLKSIPQVKKWLDKSASVSEVALEAQEEKARNMPEVGVVCVCVACICVRMFVYVRVFVCYGATVCVAGRNKSCPLACSENARRNLNLTYTHTRARALPLPSLGISLHAALSCPFFCIMVSSIVMPCPGSPGS